MAAKAEIVPRAERDDTPSRGTFSPMVIEQPHPQARPNRLKLPRWACGTLILVVAAFLVILAAGPNRFRISIGQIEIMLERR
jgi:hypothetical protein